MKDIVPETVIIPISTIMVDDRLREIDPDWVDFLSVSMEENGLRTPIWVQEADGAGLHSLIAGGHRLAAARKLGWTEIRADIFSVDGIDARILEIDENLFRRELSPLDQSVSLAERKALYEAKYPETKRGGDRKSDQSDNLVSLIPSFAEATAIKLGVDARTVFRAIARADKIAPDVRKKIATTWIAAKGSLLDALIRLEPDVQRKVVDALLREGGPKTIAAALVELNGTPIEENAEDADYQALVKAWRRAGARGRDAFVEFLKSEGALADAVMPEAA